MKHHMCHRCQSATSVVKNPERQERHTCRWCGRLAWGNLVSNKPPGIEDTTKHLRLTLDIEVPLSCDPAVVFHRTEEALAEPFQQHGWKILSGSSAKF